MRSTAAAALGTLLCAPALTASAAVAEGRDPSQALAAVADHVWQHVLETTPYFRLKYGIPVTRLPPLSAAETSAETRFYSDVLERLAPIDPRRLDEEEQITLSILRWSSNDAVAAGDYHWFVSPITPYASPLPGVHDDIPAQALGYMMGAREIRLLRARAAEALGERFDVRRFHRAVIGSGGMPLSALRARVDRFIERERGGP